MKALTVVIIGMALIFGCALQAQVIVLIKIGALPLWGPAGYKNVQYYYLPDVEAYYDVPASLFIYHKRGVWIHRTNLPNRFRNYDLYNGYKVVLTDFIKNAPYVNFNEHKLNYARGYRGLEQKTIGEKPGRGDSEISSTISQSLR